MIRAYVILLVVILVFYAGCSGGPGPVDQDFKQGTGTITLDFMSNNPPTEIIQNQEVPVVLRVENVGAYDVNRGHVTLTTDSSVIEFFGTTDTFSLQGKSADNPRGGASVVSFNGRALPLPQESQTRNVQLIATACYDYRTEIFDEVCIDQDPFNLQPDSQGCEVQDLSPSTGGGPVKISKVAVRYTDNNGLVTPKFTITVSHSGSGILFERGKGAFFCTNRGQGGDIINKVFFRATLSDQELFCDKTLVSLIQGKGTVSCEGLPIDTSQTLTSFEAPLNIELDYGYAITESKTVRIVR